MNIPPKADILRRLDSALLMFKVTCSEYPDMRVNIKPGTFWDNGTNFVEFPGGTSRPLMAPNFGAQLVLIGVSTSGSIAVIYGDPGCENLKPPECPKTVLPCAMILLRNTSTAITQEMIFDCRPVFYTRYPVAHNDLADRNEPDCHGILSITGLLEELQKRPDLEQLSNILASKADVNGTNSPVFVLNNAGSGVPTFDAMLIFQRGDIPNSILRFSCEPGGGILYSDDNGTTWTSITDIYTKEDINALLEGKADRIHDHVTLETPVTKMIYVDASRDDEYIANGNITKPFHNINDAIEIADPGDIINIMPGTYVENLDIPDGVSLISPAVAKAFIQGEVNFPYSNIPVTISNIVFKDGNVSIDARAEIQSCYFYSPVLFRGSSMIMASDSAFICSTNAPAITANGQELNLMRCRINAKGPGTCITSNTRLIISLSHIYGNSFNNPSVVITGGDFRLIDTTINNDSDNGTSIDATTLVQNVAKNIIRDIDVNGNIKLGDAVTVVDGCDMSDGSISGNHIILRSAEHISYGESNVKEYLDALITKVASLDDEVNGEHEGSVRTDIRALQHLTSKIEMIEAELGV